MELLLRNLARVALLAFLAFGMTACGGSDNNPRGDIGDSDGGDGTDTTPDPFTFTDIADAVPNFNIVSAPIVVSGLDNGVEINASITGGSMSVNAGAPGSENVKVKNGNQIIVTVTSPSPGETATAILTLGGVSDDFTVTAAGPNLAIANEGGRFRMTWNAMSGASGYEISEDRTGADGFTSLGMAGSGATAFETSISAHRYAWGEARFALEACDSGNTCTVVAEITPTQVDSVGTITYAKSDEAERSNAFGASVALDAAGVTAAVGEPFRSIESADDGMVHIFTRELDLTGKGPWMKQATVQLPADHLGGYAQFGFSVALSDDGNTLVVGAPFSRNGSSTGNGSVCVFMRTGAAWDAGTCIDNPSSDADHFGEAVAINENGDRIVIGAPLEDSDSDDPADNDGGADSGAAYVFDLTGDTWNRVAYLKQGMISSGAKFGTSVAVSGKGIGGFILVGAPEENGSGAAYYFKDVGQGDIVLAQTFRSNHPDQFDHFGRSVAISTGGMDVLVGAPGDDSSINANSNNNDTSASGAIYVMDPSGGTQKQFLKAPNITIGGTFGNRVAISRDGTSAVGTLNRDLSSAVGINGDDTDASLEADAGGMYYLEKDAQGTWSVMNYVKATNTGNGDGIVTGAAGGISRDGSTLIMGLPGEDSASTGLNGDQDNDPGINENTGAAYLY